MERSDLRIQYRALDVQCSMFIFLKTAMELYKYPNTVTLGLDAGLRKEILRLNGSVLYTIPKYPISADLDGITP
jgi:hypothetical protein